MANRSKTSVKTTFAKEDDKYTAAKQDLMTDEEMELASKIQDWYRDSYQDKDERGIFDKMETADLYWEGDQNPPESDYDPASNTNIVNSTIEGQVAYLVEQNISVEAKPRGPSDLAFRSQAVSLMEWCKDQNRMRRKLDVHERRRKKFGTGIFRVLFNPEALDSFGIPQIEAVNPAYVFTDPVVTDIYRIQEGRFLIETINRSIESARELFGDDYAEAIVPGYYPMQYDDIFGEFDESPLGEISKDHYLHLLVWLHAWVDDEDAIASEQAAADAELAAGLSDENSDEPEAMSGYEGESKADARPKKGKPQKKVLRLIEMSACGVILRDTLADDVLICEDDNRFPYFFTPDMYREGTVWAKSTAELLIPEQDAINDIEDQIRYNARMTGNPQREVDVNSGIDPDKITNEGGLVIPTNNIGGMQFLTPPSMPTYIINYRTQKLQYERTVVSRWSDQMNGVKQSGVDTATESLGLQQAGTQNISHDKTLLEETLGEVFEYCLVLMMENFTETEIFRITENGNDGFKAINPSMLKQIPQLVPASESFKQNFLQQYPNTENIPEFVPHPEGLTKKIALDISVSVGAGIPQNKAFLFQMLQNAYKSGVITGPEYRKAFIEYIGLPFPEDLPQPPMPPQMPGAPGAGPLQNPLVQGLAAGGAPMAPGGGA